jgi:oligoribonuclease NrnB/cAMP/cGMP phosphodiesterase (DHH superfamily)
VQLFFVLENSRFNRDINKSFKEVANEKIKHYIKKFPAGQIMLETVEKQLQNILTRYKNTYSPQSIPFAFKSKIGSKSMEELREICRKKGITGYSKYNKKDLVDFIVKKLKSKKS